MTSREKNRVLKSETLNLFQNNRVNSLSLLFLSLQFKFSVHSCILCCLITFPSHPFAYFLTSGCLPQTSDNSNCFRFPLKVRVIRSRLYFRTQLWVERRNDRKYEACDSTRALYCMTHGKTGCMSDKTECGSAGI